MPTIQQLPQLTNSLPTDEMLVERNGVSYGSNVAAILSSTQSALTLPSGVLVGRVSTGPGGPEPVAVGSGLKLQSGQLTVDQSQFSALNSPAFTGTPTAPTPASSDASNALATTAFVKSQLQNSGAVTIQGDVSGVGAGTITVSLPPVGQPGVFTKVSVNSKGQVTAGAQISSQDVLPLLPIATGSTPGVVKIGSGISVAIDGTIDVNDGLKTVHDFGAVGDGMTDDTQAFIAYATWLRQQANSNGAQQAWVLGFGRRYILNQSIDFTNYRYFVFEGHDSQIISNVKGAAVIDALGTENCTIRDLSIYSGSPTNPALIGLQLGVYSYGFGHPQNTIENVTITGFFSQACVFNAGSETTSFVDLKIVNEYVGSTWCYGLIQDATGFWPITSNFVAISRPANVAESFNENLFIRPIIQMSGGGPAVWMSATHRHSYKTGYFAVGANVPAAVLNFYDLSGGAHTQTLLEWDVHCEVAPSAVFLLTGWSAPILEGLVVRDHLVQAQYLFATDSTVSTVSVRDAHLSVPGWYSPSGAAQSFFDVPTKFNLLGTVNVSSASSFAWSPPALFVGVFRSDDLSSFSFGAGSVLAQSFSQSKFVGPFAATGALSAGNAAAVLGSDSANGNLKLGVAGAGMPYVEFWGGGVSGAAASIKLVGDQPHQLSITAPGASATLNVAGNVTASGTGSFSSGLTTPNLTVTGAIATSTVFAGPATGSGAPSFRNLTGSEIGGVELVANKGQASGYAALDVSGKVPSAQLPSSVVGGLIYQGAWNASTNAPALSSGTGAKGAYYTVSTAGSVAVDGNTLWAVGDHVAFNGTHWERFQGAAPPVASVAGRTGAIVLSATDVTGLATVATSGSYLDLSNRPVAPTVASAGLVQSTGSTFGVVTLGTGLTYSSGTLAAVVPVASVAGRTGAVVLSATDVAGLATVATSGSYLDLSNRPVVPTVASAGLVQSTGSTFGVVTLGTGLTYASGTLTTTGVVMSSGPVFSGNIRCSTTSGIAAAGTSQAAATALTADLNEVTTVVNGANGVLLPDPGIGAEIIVRNAQGSVALLVYPQTGQTIDLGAANSPLSVGGNTTKVFRKMTSSKWYSQ